MRKHFVAPLHLNNQNRRSNCLLLQATSLQPSPRYPFQPMHIISWYSTMIQLWHGVGKHNTLDGMSFKLYLKCVALFPGLPRFCSSVCIQNNIQKRKSGEKQGRPGNTYHMTWTWGRCKATNLCTVNVREIEMVSGNDMHRLEGITRRRLRGSSLEEKAIASSSLVVKV